MNFQHLSNKLTHWSKWNQIQASGHCVSYGQKAHGAFPTVVMATRLHDL